MATSGYFLTSESGRGDSYYYGRMIFEWWRTSYGISGSVGYHNISYHLKTYGGLSNYWQYFYNGSMNVDGSGYSFASPTQAFGNGATVFGDYSKTLYTNSVGARSFSASAQGGIYYNSINTSGGDSWALPNVDLYGGITSVTPSSSLTDETSSIVVDLYKYAGTAHLWFRLDLINSSDTTYHITNPSDPYSWSGFSTWLRTSMVNTNSTTLYIYYGDDFNSDGVVDHWNSASTYTITIKNNTGQANPTFADFDYIDTNAATVAVTGSDQVLIQGKSTLQATVAVADKATPNKNANMSQYVFSIGGYSQSSAYSAVSNVVKSIGAISDVSGLQNLSVKAVDSRSNYKTITKSVNILPYSSPSFVPTLLVKYTNDFDTSDGITVTASSTTIANISPLTLSSVDKNSVNGTSGVKFDISKGDNSSYTGTWVNVATSQTSGTGAITSTLSTIATNILTKINGLTADNTVRWYVKFSITDALETVYYETYIDIGKPIFRIGADGYLYNNEQRLMPSHVGQIIMTTSLTTAAAVQAIYGGTWAAFGAGKTIVGLDSGDTAFDTVEETGGVKEVTLTSAQSGLPAHTHVEKVGNGSSGSTLMVPQVYYNATASYDTNTSTKANTAANAAEAHTNLQPYIVVYMWKRTA